MSTEAQRMIKAMNATKNIVNGVCEMMGDAPDDAWEKVAQLDADYNYAMVEWITHGGPERLAAFRKAHDRLKKAWAVFGEDNE